MSRNNVSGDYSSEVLFDIKNFLKEDISETVESD
jgi:hypothetical protein